MDAVVRTLGLACLSILLLPTTDHVAAAPGALVSLYGLTNKADAVVVARIRDVPSVSYNSAHFSIIVERALKGSAAPDQLLEIATVPHHLLGCVVEKQRGLFFLRQSAPGKWQAMPLVSGSSIITLSTFVLLAEDARPKLLVKHLADSVHARVVAEVAGSRETPEGRSLLIPVDLNGEYIQLNHWPATLFEH